MCPDDLAYGVLEFSGVDMHEAQTTSGAWFMRDTEWSWMLGSAPVDDL
ncbi:hypothetical protein [Microbacterium ulmi]|uniref:Uncharacterized protein n=1 Tax=Microbacterium ulmi TaxID=179095 RepID=A0A7Y2LZQ1_9MICO|nr:hypothetical protein [Microbacterium ulmi]NII71156.1 hypothetical protein [Microbacterium ulmi]NNH02463.1 hypothetical protein [Microbacterium ulmi]